MLWRKATSNCPKSIPAILAVATTRTIPSMNRPAHCFQRTLGAFTSVIGQQHETLVLLRIKHHLAGHAEASAAVPDNRLTVIISQVPGHGLTVFRITDQR